MVEVIGKGDEQGSFLIVKQIKKYWRYFKMNEFSIVILITVILIVIVLFNTAKVVPQRQEYIVERLGKFSRTLSAGLHLLVPFWM